MKERIFLLTLAHMVENLFRGENQVVCKIGLLSHFSIHLSSHATTLRTLVQLRADQDRTNRRETVERFSKEVLTTTVVRDLEQATR